MFLRMIVLAISVGLTFSSGFCGDCQKDRCKDRPDWGYSYDDPHYLPDCGPCGLSGFHQRMIPMMEARKSAESAYIREGARGLYEAARKIRCDRGCEGCRDRSHFRRAVKDLVRECKELRELSHGATSESLYAQMKEVEDDYLRIASLLE